MVSWPESWELLLVIEETMTISLVIGICHLFPEFPAHALGVFGALHAAGAVATCTLQALPDHFDNFLILVQPDCHPALPFLIYETFHRVPMENSRTPGVRL